MKIKTANLLEILNHFKFVFNDNNYIKEANYIFFNSRYNRIWCYSSNLVYIYKYEGSLKEDYELVDSEIAIPAKELFALIKKIKAEEIAVKQMDNSFIIKNGRSNNTFSIPTVTSDSNKLNMKPTDLFPVPSTFHALFKKYFIYDKTKEKCDNIIFENNSMVSSDNYSIVRTEFLDDDFKCNFAITWDVAKHISDNNFLQYSDDEDIIFFEKGNLTLVCANTINNIFPYEDVFANALEEVSIGNSIHMSKDQNIDFIDVFLLNYKKLDKKIIVNVINDKRIMVVATGENGAKETRASINIDKYTAGHAENFQINSSYFKDIFYDYDYFNVLDGVLYCYNIDDNVERICVIKNMEHK